MPSKIRWFWGALAVLIATAQGAVAQYDSGGDWDPSIRGLERRTGPHTGNAPLEALNKILSTSQLSPVDRTVYLSIRAFQLSRIGREADSRKDVAEMGRLLPTVWQVVLSSTQPELAGGGDRAAALRTLEYGLQRKPGDPWLMIAQAQVNMQIADFPRALSLLDDAVAATANEAERRAALYYRGHANLNLGRFERAADDFAGSLVGRRTLASRLPPLLWRYAAQVHTRRNARDALAGALGSQDLSLWPGPIAQFLLGRLPPGELEVIAESDESARRTNGKCPAAFFLGIEALRRGDRQRARERFELAQARCPTVSEFDWAASSELKRM
jgi:tetratricopeptide (TPR) repeat protein